MQLGSRLLATVEGVVIAFDAIRSNRIRAALTIMGVAVGVFVVVAMAATIHGISASFKKDLDDFGATTFSVRRRGVGMQGCDGSDESCPERKWPPITLDEVRAIGELPSVEEAVPWLFGGASIRYKDKYLSSVNFEGYGPRWLHIDGGADIAPGRDFTDQEYQSAAPVVIVNDTLSKQLFGQSDPIGKQVLVNGRQFTVVGVYQTTTGFLKSLDGRGPDTPKMIFTANTAHRQLDADLRWLLLWVKPRGSVERSIAEDEVTATLRGKRGLHPSQPNNFAIVGEERILELFNQIFGAIFLVGLALSAVALLVGGVGVVAIMMISVTERTREIGIRKALGASKGTILWQFLVEAATLTSIGAAIGLILGGLLAWGIRANTNIPAAVPVPAIVAALVTSALTGILFGMAPAARAAKLDPVEALRYE
ncbi:MAG: ABC transporter permease [Gemmatimonadaceae bacterium]